MNYLIFVLIEKMLKKLETVFNPISTQLESRQKYSTTMRRIFSFFLGVWKSELIVSIVFDILLIYSREYPAWIPQQILGNYSYFILTFSLHDMIAHFLYYLHSVSAENVLSYQDGIL